MAATTMMWSKICFALICVLAYQTGITSSTKSKSISLNLSAKWKYTPVILEISEFLAKENNDVFWSFVNELATLNPMAYDNSNEESMYHLGLKLTDKLLTPLKMNLLKFAIAMRAHSPAVEMYNQMAYDRRPPKHCDAFVDINNLITCEKPAIKPFLAAAEQQAKPAVIKSDHHYPGTKDLPITVILYAQMGTEAFSEYHQLLQPLAQEGKINYIFRHYIKVIPDYQVRLSGYGVGLSIKNQEYKAKDDTKVDGDGDKADEEDHDEEDEVEGFMFNHLKDLYPELKDNLEQFRTHLLETTSDLAPLKVWQLQDLSFQAAQRVMMAPPEEGLKVLRDISQNFPIMARSLVRTQVTDDLRREIKKNQKYFENTFGLGAGESALFINGLQADLDIYDVFTLLETLKSEAKLMEGLHALGIKGDKLATMMKLDVKESDSNYAVDIRNYAIIHLNDLEKDKRYSGWPSSVQDLLRPTFPGMLRHVRKNLFHLTYFVDPSDKKYKDLLKMAEAFYVHNAPIRIGVVFVVNSEEDADAQEDAGVAMSRAFKYISKKESPVKALSFITDIYERVGEDEITAKIVMDEFTNEFDDDATAEVFAQGKSKLDAWRKASEQYFHMTGLGELPQVLVNGAPMKKEDMAADSFEEAVVSGILKSTPEIQRSVYNGQLSDNDDMLDFLMSKPNVMPRLNARVLSSGGTYLDFTKDTPGSLMSNPDAYNNLPVSDMTAAMINSLRYMTRKETPVIRPITLWIVTDLSTAEGRNFLYQATKHLRGSNDMRLGVVHNPSSDVDTKDSKANFVSRAVQVAMETLSPEVAKMFVPKMLKQDNLDALNSGEKTMNDFETQNMDMDAYISKLEESSNSFLVTHRTFCDRVLEFEAGARGIVTNGKVLGPLKAGEAFLQEDYSLLEKYTSGTSAESVKNKVKSLKLDPERGSDMVMRVSALLMSEPQTEGRKEVEYEGDRFSVLNLPAKSDGPAYDVVAILDPTTQAAQKYTPLIMVLSEVANTNIRVFLNSREKLSEMPLKNFYRYVLDSEISFTVDSSAATGPGARFNNMPQTPLLTLSMDPPESWLVQATHTKYDLDNIYLNEIEGNVHAEFELESLLLEGHCYDSTTGQPPRGLQFILGTNNTHAMVDTIVMANLGYFQLKASPGAWILRLRPGQSAKIYDIISHDYTDSPSDSQEVITVIDSFKSKIIKVRVSKKAGMEEVDLLGGEESGGLWDSISKRFSGGTALEETGEEQTINIFSLASGHLYERFLRIMMLSVLKHTQSRVKFWFLKNYLSPTFKDFIPHMAEQYGFDYELVQYKWPRWLHQQSEKQRIIWGYKILFLDVLFPLNVEKIIFVDADQIVRADLQELMDMDLEGAPYAYTPFCDSRREMDGFRFWKSGYWASHLAGRRYHISALYVVDLKKFRKIAAGDRLRGQYQGLSQDPNSLSNLDQDLPNNMIHQVNIKSLPQEWLWCETWCSEGEKAYAKTIDMCNNPQTKEPKLQAAQRIAPEWKEYDREAKQLWDKVFKGSSSSSSSSSSSPSSSQSQGDSQSEQKDEL